MDNARIHHGDEIAELADRFGMNLEGLWMHNALLTDLLRCQNRIPTTLLS